MSVSVVIPAYNAADTVSGALESLRAQTSPEWEAIVVDDGSDDDTVEVARGLAGVDERVRVVSGTHDGVCAARNRGIDIALYEWLLFLDSDDWIDARHIELMTKVLAKDDAVDAIVCGWANVGPDGTHLASGRAPAEADLFRPLARARLFPINACVVRRSRVQAVGAFDQSLRACEDWDLWQRLARAGARFSSLEDVLALCRSSTHGVVLDPLQVAADGAAVIARGHAGDVRVSDPVAEHSAGAAAEEFGNALFVHLAWVAGLCIGSGLDPSESLKQAGNLRARDLDPAEIAERVLQGAAAATGAPRSELAPLWPRWQPLIAGLLRALEQRSATPALARRTTTVLERLILQPSRAPRPLTVGATHAVSAEVTEPISDMVLSARDARALCRVEFDGEPVGDLELPATDGLLSPYVLSDAIAARFAWDILGRFFARTVYQELREVRTDTGVTLCRAEVPAAQGLPEDPQAMLEQRHDAAGWCIFLQELWGRPLWALDAFYDEGWLIPPDDPLANAAVRDAPSAAREWFSFEVGDHPTHVLTTSAQLDVLVTVGGVPLGFVPIPAHEGRVTARRLLTAVTSAGGLELCRAVVRETLIGRPIDSSSLRARLLDRARVEGSDEMGLSDGPFESAARLRAKSLWPDAGGLVLGRRGGRIAGTSWSRRATLPLESGDALRRMATVVGEPLADLSNDSRSLQGIVYAPDTVAPDAAAPDVAAPDTLALDTVAPPSEPVGARGDTGSRPDDTAGDARTKERSYFESLFASGMDPWRYTSAYEQTKYEQTLSLVPRGRLRRALELACAEGHFTARLAARVESLLAADISEIALSRAAERCKDFGNVEYVLLDLVKDDVPTGFDLIVCSEVLYFMGSIEQLEIVAGKMLGALSKGGHLLMAHANVVIDDPGETGFDWDMPYGAKTISEVFSRHPDARLVKEIRTPLYRIQLFERRRARWLLARAAEVIELSQQPTEPPPRAANSVLWGGGRATASAPEHVETAALPILMYHRVAPTGVRHMARYRLTPAALEEQLRYLRDIGCYGIQLGEWLEAVESKRPLPGRAVLLTFDDAFQDFADHAWPLLQEHGFPATVFVPTGLVGQHNAWDDAYGEKVPLMSWDQIGALADEGVTFGSHSVRHPYLTGVSFAHVVSEAALSRATLARRLDRNVEAFAYPYGDHDPAIEHLIGACGYLFGLTVQPAHATLNGSLLSLPRIEIRGDETFEQFVRRVGARGRAGAP